MEVFSKKFLIITAHPDDLEMGCSGLVTKIKLAGGQVTNLILVKPSAEQNEKRNEQIAKGKKARKLFENQLHFEEGQSGIYSPVFS